MEGPLRRILLTLALVGATIAHTTTAPAASNDILLPDQWGLHRIKADDAWAKSTGKGITVAIVDSGINFNHADLRGKSAGSMDCLSDPCVKTSENSDQNGHGTAVGGVVGALTNNERGIAAVAPDAKLLSVKVFGAEGSTSYDVVARGIRAAADAGAKVINLSLGTDVLFGPANTVVLSDSMSYANNIKGAILVAAAGNSGFASSYASNEFVYVVGATGPDDEIAAYSDSFLNIDVHAPGGNASGSCSSAKCIVTTSKGGAYESTQGTSLAAPHASGLAALLMSQGLSNAETAQRMTETADSIDNGKNKRINAARAVGASESQTSDQAGSQGGASSGNRSGTSGSGGKSGQSGSSQEQGQQPQGDLLTTNPVTDERPDDLTLGQQKEDEGTNWLLYVLIGLGVLGLPALGYFGYRLGSKPKR